MGQEYQARDPVIDEEASEDLEDGESDEAKPVE